MPSFDQLTELEIIERIVSGEKALFEMIVRRFNPCLYKIGRSYNYSHQDTQDLMQETFINAYKNLSQFEGRSGFKTWLIRIMMNHCYRKSRSMAFKNSTVPLVHENSIPMFTHSDNSTEKTTQSRELARIIENALSNIPFNYRIVFSLREINGLNVSETAGLLNLTETNIKVRLNRAKTMLKNEIEKVYSANELFEFNLVYCDAIVNNVMKEINAS